MPRREEGEGGKREEGRVRGGKTTIIIIIIIHNNTNPNLVMVLLKGADSRESRFSVASL